MMRGDQAVRQFVKGALGCACDDRVFDTIERAETRLPGGERCIELVIGDRLLVRVIGPVDANAVPQRLRAWIDGGVSERDRRGLRRFRLALHGPDRRGLEAAMRDAVVPPDENVFLHILDEEDVPELV